MCMIIININYLLLNRCISNLKQKAAACLVATERHKKLSDGMFLAEIYRIRMENCHPVLLKVGITVHTIGYLNLGGIR